MCHVMKTWRLAPQVIDGLQQLIRQLHDSRIQLEPSLRHYHIDHFVIQGHVALFNVPLANFTETQFPGDPPDQFVGFGRYEQAVGSRLQTLRTFRRDEFDLANVDDFPGIQLNLDAPKRINGNILRARRNVYCSPVDDLR